MAKIQIRRATTAEWAAANPILAKGEQGFDLTLKKKKIGDGTTQWSALDFEVAGSADKINASGTSRTIFVSTSEPTSGVVAGDIWIKTA